MSFLVEDCRAADGDLRSIYIKGGAIERLSSDETQRVPDGTPRLDARGGTLLPGLVDTHCHPFELGWLRRNVDLRGTASITELRLRLSARLQKTSPGEWVLGRGWDEEAYSDRRLPRKEDINDLTPYNPVILSRVCGHIALVNSRTIEALGLQSEMGEEYPRGADGALTGIIKEGAMESAYSRVPASSVESTMADLLAVEFEASKSGLTTLHCILSLDDYREELDALARLESEGRLTLRYRVYIPFSAIEYVEEKGLRKKFDDEQVRLNGVKLYADGALGARTAALREPYSDEPGNSGLLRYSDETLADLVEKIDSLGYQAIIHAIGDRGVEQAVDALSRVTSRTNEKRHRIEHASLSPKDLRSKMKKYSIGVTVQPQFIISDSWARQRLGDERVRDLYPLRSLLEEGIIESGSSDAPVETLSPIIGMWAATVRSGYAPQEKVGVLEALRLCTANAAFNGLDESSGGSIREGSCADLVVLDSNLDGIHPAMLRKVGVVATIVNGRLVYSYEGSS